MSGFFWQEAFSVHVKEIDEQHKSWMELFNKLDEAIRKKTVERDLVHIFDEIYDFTRLHFSTEEKYFKLFKYEDSENHAQAHAKFLERLGKLREKMHEDNSFQVSLDLAGMLEVWVTEHVLKADKKYEECFHKHGLH